MLHALCMGIRHTTCVEVRGQACGMGSLFVFWGSNLGCQTLMTRTSTCVYRNSTKIFSIPYLSCSSQPQGVSMPTAQRRKGAQGGKCFESMSRRNLSPGLLA